MNCGYLAHYYVKWRLRYNMYLFRACAGQRNHCSCLSNLAPRSCIGRTGECQINNSIAVEYSKDWKSKDFHHLRAGATPDDDCKNTYICVLLFPFRIYIFSTLQRFCTQFSCLACFHATTVSTLGIVKIHSLAYKVPLLSIFQSEAPLFSNNSCKTLSSTANFVQ